MWRSSTRRIASSTVPPCLMAAMWAQGRGSSSSSTTAASNGQKPAAANDGDAMSIAEMVRRLEHDAEFRRRVSMAMNSSDEKAAFDEARSRAAATHAQEAPNTTSSGGSGAASDRPHTTGGGGGGSAGGGMVPSLTAKQWSKCFVRTAAPFFGFGICDNLIMICVGDLIDTHFGVTLGFSTMVAAGLGQAVSDGAGITIQGSIEAGADRMGLPNPNLSEAQEASSRVLFWKQVFRTVGIISGCLCGLAPVILFDAGNRPRLYDQLLNVLTEEQRKELSARARYVMRDEGDVIFTYGEEADAMYTIVQGEVSVIGRSDRGDRIEFCRNGPGANLGIIELAFGHKCVADVVVTSPVVKLLRIDRNDFEKSPRIDEIRQVVTKYVEEDDTFVVYRARHMIPPKAIDVKISSRGGGGGGGEGGGGNNNNSSSGGGGSAAKNLSAGVC